MWESDTRSVESCRLAGLDCQTCILRAAEHVAMICPTVDAGSENRTFFALYPDACCKPMGSEFAIAYRNAAVRLTVPNSTAA